MKRGKFRNFHLIASNLFCLSMALLGIHYTYKSMQFRINFHSHNALQALTWISRAPKIIHKFKWHQAKWRDNINRAIPASSASHANDNQQKRIPREKSTKIESDRIEWNWIRWIDFEMFIRIEILYYKWWYPKICLDFLPCTKFSLYRFIKFWFHSDRVKWHWQTFFVYFFIICFRLWIVNPFAKNTSDAGFD